MKRPICGENLRCTG